jgi:hypothetical protein
VLVVVLALDTACGPLTSSESARNDEGDVLLVDDNEPLTRRRGRST